MPIFNMLFFVATVMLICGFIITTGFCIVGMVRQVHEIIEEPTLVRVHVPVAS